MYRLSFIAFSVFLFLLTSCGSEPTPIPRPRAYPKVEFPQRAYEAFDKDFCAFSFDFPSYAEIQRDSSYFQNETPHPCWFDIYYPGFNGRLHCSYYEIGQGKNFEELRKDAFEMADYHNKRANYIDELSIQRPDADVEGFAFAIDGPAASPFQFYLTDNKEHFFRASLYFNSKAQPDSLAPVLDFVRADVMKMIETFEWTE